MKPRVYNKNVQMTGVLQNATEVGYVRKHNDLYTASFKLPVDDSKNSLCEGYAIVEIFDGDTSKGKYRIVESPDSEIADECSLIEYNCEHVIAFLMNDIIDGYLELGGTGVNTRTVINTLLARQTTTRWQLGECDFEYFFQYSWENTNVLEALFSIPTCFSDNYIWTYDTDTYPWTINLKQQPTARDCEIRYRRNMRGIKRSIDYSKLCTRLYCKGNGEGVNQVTIKDVNSGLPYIEDWSARQKYGVLCSHFIDLTCTDPSTLLAKGRKILNEVKAPIYTYKATAIDLHKETGMDWDYFDEGKNVHVINTDKGVDVDAMIIEVSKSDVDEKPLDMEITISSKPSDVASDIEDISRRAAITAQYSQGATNLYCEQFADNADATHPATMRIYIPESCSKINQVLLNWACSAFRAYSKSAAGGGGATHTSGGGGGGSVTSGGGGNVTATVPKQYLSTGLAGVTTGPKSNNQDVSYTDTYTGYTMGGSSHAHAAKWGHQHSISSDADYTGGVRNYSSLNPYTGYESSHTHSIAHQHGFWHKHSLASLEIPSFTFTLPSHTHSVSMSSHTHSVTIPNHTHDLVYGIFEGETATSCTLKVDNITARSGVTSGSDIDIIPYLSKDSNGKINRGTWHTIQIVPNKMTRIEADLFVKTFITSYTGGNY